MSKETDQLTDTGEALDAEFHAAVSRSLGVWRPWRKGSLRKGARGWYLRYSAGRDATGHVRRPTQFLGTHSELLKEADAEQAATRFLQRVFTVQRAPGSSPPWPEYCGSYLREHVAFMRPESQATTRSVITRQILPRFAALRLHEIIPVRLQQWIREQRAARVPPGTIRHRLGILRTMLNAALEAGLTVELPLRRLRYPKANQLKRSREELVFNAEEAERLLAAAPLRTRAAVALGVYQGLRASEIVGLTWSNVDLGHALLHVTGQAQHGELVRAKTDDAAASVPMPAELVEILSAYRAACPAAATWLFPNRHGRPMTHDNLRKRHLYPLCDRLGIRRKGLHATRRRLADALSEAGAALPTIQAALRHAHASTTLRYLSPASRADVAAALAAAAAGRRRTC